MWKFVSIQKQQEKSSGDETDAVICAGGVNSLIPGIEGIEYADMHLGV
jgi:hypothetical protein